MLATLTRLFPLWALLLSVLAYYTPTTFTPIGPWVTTLLMLIMFGMGVHLKLDDFKRVLSRPAPVAAGIFLHYLVMPLAAWVLALLFHMPPELSAGMVLVGSVASGTASNVMIYLAKGDVALSVTISSVSTLVGVVATPLLTRLYVDAHIQVDVMGMLLSILQNRGDPNRPRSDCPSPVAKSGKGGGTLPSRLLHAVHPGDYQRRGRRFRIAYRFGRPGGYRSGDPA